MKNQLVLSLSVLITLHALSGCGDSEANPPSGSPSDGGGATGGANGAGGSGASSAGGAGARSAGGSSGAAGSAGAGNGGAAGANGGSAGTGSGGSAGTETDGSAGTGTGGLAGSASGGSGNAAGQGGSSTGGTAGGPANLGYILGPATDDQAPVRIATHPVESYHPLLLSDAAGNFYTAGYASGGHLDKYDQNFSLVWRYRPTISVNYSSFSMAPDGGVFFGGSINAALPGETHVGGGDAVVGKLTSSGTLAWAHQWGSSSGEVTIVTLPTADGAVIAAGMSQGQAPGMPSTVARGTWMARYNADGTRVFLQQYAPPDFFGNSTPRLHASASGEVLLIDRTEILKIDSQQGTELARITKPRPTSPISNNFGGYMPAVMTPSKDAFYTWGHFTNGNAQTSSALGKFDLHGNLLSFREAEPPRSAVLDPVENVIWNGSINTASPLAAADIALVVGSDAIYLTGIYSNSYKNGSVARAATAPFFVGRYDLNGNRVWFQELLFVGDTTPNSVSTHLAGITLDPSGNPVLAMSKASGGGGFAFRLSRSDGALVP